MEPCVVHCHSKMNSKGRTRLQTMKSSKNEEINVEILETKSRDGAAKETSSGRISRRERKKALQKDIDNLKKKLRQEENIQRALKRASTRPLGAIPRLPPFLPPYLIELIAEVAVLEEEIVRLEQQVVHLRKNLDQEAVTLSSSKKVKENLSGLYGPYSMISLAKRKIDVFTQRRRTRNLQLQELKQSQTSAKKSHLKIHQQLRT